MKKKQLETLVEKPKKKEVRVRFGLEAMEDANLTIEKARVACQVRQSHLKREKRKDPETDELLARLQGIESYIDDRVELMLKRHPAYPWFSRVKGVGRENIGKVIAPLNIEKAQTVSAFWQFTGFGVEGNNAEGYGGHALKRVKGEKMCYNSELRSLCYRLGTSLLKTGLRQQCVKCYIVIGAGTLNSEDEGKGWNGKCQKCGGTEFKTIAQTKFSAYYLTEKEKYVQRYTAAGYKIVPAEELPTRDVLVRGKLQKQKYEPEGVISEGHVHNQALRKMIKAFEACLFIYWREALGLPVRPPYAIEKMGHTHLYRPEDFVDRD